MQTGMSLVKVFFLSIVFIFAAQTAQAANASFAAGTKAFAAGHYSQALTDFLQAKDAGVEGPAIHYNIAVCQYRLQHYRQAEAEFRFVGDRYPKMKALADYNLGLTLLRDNHAAQARLEFERARQESADEKITRLAEAMLLRTVPQRAAVERGRKWVSLVDVNTGHDDNVALIDSASLPTGQSPGSPFTDVLAVVSGPISSGPGLEFNGGIYAVDYPDVSSFNQTVTRVGGAYHRMAGHWRMQAESHYSYATLAGSAFEHGLGAGVSVKRYLTRTTAIGVSLVHDQFDSGSSQFAFVQGSREQLRCSWERYGPSSRLTLSYRFESNNRNSPAVSPTRNGVAIAYRYSMNPEWSADVSLSLRSSVYSDPSVARHENRTQLWLDFRRRLSSSWYLDGRYLWAQNRSNVGAFTYNRDRFSIGVTKDF